MTAPSCRTCRHMVVPLTATGKRRVSKNGAYVCDVPIPDLPLPDSVTRGYGFGISKSRVIPEWGETCPLWAKIER